MRTALSFLGFLLAASLSAAAPARPNLIHVMADDLGWGETGYNGHPQLHTPVLDELARTALRLDRFYAASPVCSPTRASVMTGRHANRSGAFAPNWSTRPEEITVARILRDAGYRTGHFGKWHLGAVKTESPLNPGRMGFDEFLSHDNFFEMDPPLSRNGAPPQVLKGESSAVVVEAAIDFLRRVRAEREKKPFFLVVWFGSPHGPYSGLPEDIARYAAHPNPEMRARFAEITAMDRAIGTLRAALRELGVADDTLLWFNSDNGSPIASEADSFSGGWRGRKGEVYEGGLRVPGLVEWPAVITSPRHSAVPVVTSDFLPTVLDLAGVKHPAPSRPLDGLSLRHLLVGGTMTERPSPIGFWRYASQGENKHGRWLPEDISRGTTPTTKQANILFQNYKHPDAKTADFGGSAAWTDNRYKLLTGESRRDQRGARTELFDLLADPKETTDIAAAHPEIVRRMTAELLAWQRSVERSLSGADY